jgi:hypothetical protein
MQIPITEEEIQILRKLYNIYSGKIFNTNELGFKIPGRTVNFLVGQNYLFIHRPNEYSLSDKGIEIVKKETVNHPEHYNSHPKGIECIDVIEDIPHFNIANAIKYLWRAGLKTEDPLEDLEKALWYINREISRQTWVYSDYIHQI